MDSLHIFILAGGSGERFWPLSRSAKPKHLLKLLGERTLLEETVSRFQDVVPLDRIHVLTNSRQIQACREAVPFLPKEQFVAEPAKRDTAPAAALATALAFSRNKNSICALFPADAAIRDLQTFQRNLRDAVATAAYQDALLTFAIQPSHPSTGFGYLKLGEKLPEAPEGSKVCRVDAFREKPDEETAQQYLESGNYAWNAGMFVWRAEVFLRECRRLQPALADFIEAFPSTNPLPFLNEHFASLPKISVDYAIMEQANAVLALEAGFDWDDVGTWTALPAHLGLDELGNTLRGKTALIDSANNIVIGTGRTIALCGVKDLVVVETEDAILVCHRDSVQEIKNLHLNLPEENR